MNLSSRVDLRVPFHEKDQAKRFGAQWDAKNRIWYAPAGTELQQLKRWLSDGVIDMTAEAAPFVPQTNEKGIALVDLLRRLRNVIEDGFPNAEWVRAEILVRGTPYVISKASFNELRRGG
jgi:exodeoxyribonuclease VII large subunit